MGLKSYKPYTKSTRTTVLVDRKNVWKGSPYKPLTRGKHSSGGRNNLGRITSRARGAGHKKRYRIIDFHRNKIDNVLIVSDKITEKNILKSVRNLRNVKLVTELGTNVYDLVKYKNVLFTTSSIKNIQDRLTNEKN